MRMPEVLTFDEARELAYLLAPELRGKFETVMHQPDWPIPPRVLAYAYTGVHEGIRDELIRVGRWRNVYPTTVIFCTLPTVEILIHELAHALPVSEPIPDDFGEDAEFVKNVSTLRLKEWEAGTDKAQSLPWDDHGHRFIRRVVHLVHRAERLGVTVRTGVMMAAGDGYGLYHHLDAYQDALNVEPFHFFGSTFAEIEAAPLPDMFRDMFAGDVGRWYRENFERENR